VSLPEIRRKIDAVDEQLIALFNERADLVHQVGEVKRAEGTEIYAPEREEHVLRSLVEKNRALNGRLPEKSIRGLRVILARTMDDVLAAALLEAKTPRSRLRGHRVDA